MKKRIKVWTVILALLVVSITLFFVYAIAEDIEVKAVGETRFELSPGKTATFSVTANPKDNLTCQWFLSVGGPAGKRIEGETNWTYTTSKSGSYRCRVYNGDREVGLVDFYVDVDNDLQAEAVDNEVFEYSPEKEITLGVSASCNTGLLSYQWYKRAKNAGPGGVLIEGLTESSCTVKQDGDYYCLVEDEYGNSREVWFSADTQTNIEVECGTNIVAEKGSTVTLKVNVTSLLKEITYQWCIERSGPPLIINGETTDTLVVENVQENKTYRCDIMDELGRYYIISITVTLGHPETESMPAVEATCVKTGLTEGKKCSACNEILVAQQVIPALGHLWGEGVITKEASYAENGIRTFTCKRCGETRTEEISIKIHIGKTGWVKNSDGSWSFGNSNGDAVVGPMYIDGTWYCFNEQGRMITGWAEVGSKWYYAKSSGAIYHNGWVQVGDIWYYFRPNGEMAVGWVYDNGAYYYMNTDGAMATGWIEDSGNWYYMDENGAMKTGWMLDGKTWYLLKPSGEMATGWYREGGSWYYFNTSGAMVDEWQQINGSWYYFKNGAMVTGWFEDKEAEAKLPSNQKKALWYWFDNNGQMATGWKEINGQWEMFADSGMWLYTWDGQ